MPGAIVIKGCQIAVVSTEVVPRISVAIPISILATSTKAFAIACSVPGVKAA